MARSLAVPTPALAVPILASKRSMPRFFKTPSRRSRPRPYRHHVKQPARPLEQCTPEPRQHQTSTELQPASSWGTRQMGPKKMPLGCHYSRGGRAAALQHIKRRRAPRRGRGRLAGRPRAPRAIGAALLLSAGAPGAPGVAGDCGSSGWGGGGGGSEGPRKERRRVQSGPVGSGGADAPAAGAPRRRSGAPGAGGKEGKGRSREGRARARRPLGRLHGGRPQRVRYGVRAAAPCRGPRARELRPARARAKTASRASRARGAPRGLAAALRRARPRLLPLPQARFVAAVLRRFCTS
jgi:hypothetical protein